MATTDRTDRICQCGLPQSKHSPFHFRCGGFKPANAVDMRRESAALIAGANSAATKRARGQELIPKFTLKNSTPRARRVKEAA